ncbi:MAG: hypothetical protein LBQ84_04295 [Flavobacteriaceae bacterium]|jgi:hypothetical protein|nr:hypothetical protein [Flavobacteriaceae bacterium]
MKNNFITLLTLLLSVNLFSQSTDLDKFYFKTESLLLPAYYFPEEERTFYINVSANKTGISFDAEQININGYKRDSENKTGIEIEVYLPNGFNPGEPEVVKRTETIKDRNDNTIQVNYYKVNRRYNYGTFNKAIIKDRGIKKALLLSYEQEYATKEYESSEQAIDEYNLKKGEWNEDFRKRVVQSNYIDINSYFNKLLGYTIYREEIKLWLLGSTKNPEYEKHQQALEIIQNAFKDVKYNYLPEDIEERLKPAILIFEELLQKYREDNKKSKKIRYASYYNLMKIYYCIDNFNKAVEYANLLINNGYDKKDGSNMLEEINKKREGMNLNKVKSLHFDIQNYNEYAIKHKQY